MRSLRSVLGGAVNSFLQPLGARLVLVAPPEPQSWAHPKSPDKLHSRFKLKSTYSPWINDPDFNSIYPELSGLTYVDIYRCYELWTIAAQMKAIPGDFLEVGVWKGGTGLLLATAATRSRKNIYLADTFNGVVKAGSHDTRYVGGEHSDASADAVAAVISRHGLTNTTLLVGVFPEDTGHRIPGALSLVHVDVDVYQSAKDVVEAILPRLSAGGVIVFDDYGQFGCEGIVAYVDELRATNQDLFFTYNVNGHAVMVNLPRHTDRAGSASAAF